MNTSYFSKHQGINGVSIATKAPEGFNGRRYPQLYPKWWFFKIYKDTGNKEHYTKHYHKEILNKLNPQRVYEDLGENAVLLCWEKTGEFCHRHLVADWLMNKLGIKIY